MKKSGFDGVVTYYSQALAADRFDISITPVPNDKAGQHGNVELVFLQEKGSNARIDVVAAIRMQTHQLAELHALIGRKLKAVSIERSR